MVVQAGAAERLLGREPDRALEALEAIRNAGGEALDELRRLLGLLRDHPGGSSSAEPQPGLARLDHLIDGASASGLAVRYVVEGESVALPPGIDLAAYRIVQESLTNVRKHAASKSVVVRISYSPRALELRVTNDGVTASLNGNGNGHGLIGMRERVALYGGTLVHGPLTVDRFEVHVTIPLESSTP